MEQKLTDKDIKLDYSGGEWEIDDITVDYEEIDDYKYDFKKKVLSFMAVRGNYEEEDGSGLESNYVEIKINTDDYARLIASLIQDHEFAEKVLEHLEDVEYDLVEQKKAWAKKILDHKAKFKK